jgi:hypothetical protein
MRALYGANAFSIRPHRVSTQRSGNQRRRNDMASRGVGRCGALGAYSVADLVAHIDSFIANYNAGAKPFVWTKTMVHQKRLKPCFADQ